MAYRGKYAGQSIVRPSTVAKGSLTYSPSGVLYPQDEKSQTALLKPYGTITASEMGHIGGGIVRRLVGKGRILEHLERQAREHHQIGEAAVFLLFIDPRDGQIYVQKGALPIEQVRESTWQSVADVDACSPIPASTPTSLPARTRMLPPTLVPSAKLVALRTEALKTRTTRLLSRLGRKQVVSRPLGS